MRVTPLDIIKKEFTPSKRGVDEIEVKNFLEDVRETLDDILKENQRLRDLIGRRDEEILELRGEELSIKDTLVLARRLTEDLERKARRESDLIIGEARLESQQILMAAADEDELADPQPLMDATGWRPRTFESAVEALMASC